MTDLDASTAFRLQHGAVHLHTLGPRSIAEFLAEVARETGSLASIIDRLAEYRRRMSPEMVRLVGADRFPRRVPLMVPA